VVLTPFLNPVTFVAPDIERLLLYALPGVIPLALVVVERTRLLGVRAPSPAPAQVRRPWRIVWGGFAAAAMALPFVVVDRYRRVDLRGARDAPVTLAVLRETLQTARGLEDGRPFVFDPSQGRFSRGFQEPFDLSQLRHVRWFLKDGWDPSASTEGADAVMQGPEATILLPCLRPRDLEVRLALDAPAPVRVVARVGSHAVGEALATPEGASAQARIPAALLVRGDNVLVLATPDGGPAPRVRLLGLTVRPSTR
jgi:hypothetical protein